MRIVKLTLAILIFGITSYAQDNSLLNTHLVPKERTKDIELVHHLIDSSRKYEYTKPEIGLEYANDALSISQELSYGAGIAMSYITMSSNLSQLGAYAGSIDLAFRALNIFRKENNINGIQYAQYSLGGVFKNQGDFASAIKHLKNAYKSNPVLDSDSIINLIQFTVPFKTYQAYQEIELADCYIEVGQDSALLYARKSFSYFYNNGDWQFPYYVMGKVHMNLSNFDSALYYYRAGLNYTGTQNSTDVSKIRIGIARTFQKMGILDSTVYHAGKAIELAYSMSYLKGVNEASELLANAYEKINPVKSIQYFKLNKITADSLFNQKKTRDIQNLAFRQELEDREIQKQLDESEIRYRNRLTIYIFSGGISILLIVAVGLWRRSVFKQKALTLVNKQKQEIESQKLKVENTLYTLQTAQSQLIQSEKMASLGELTAGIAHEIQNPLNFVNNFSEVNAELIEELKAESVKPKAERDIKLEEELLNTIAENEQKINHHGKRADAIVKGMLQHSRSSSGQKEPTDINVLCDEYLRLSYHGYRAKDNPFNAKFEFHPDPTLPKVKVVPQDIGRVVLNLINNAFYAVSEKQKAESAKPGSSFEPTVIVSTHYSLSSGEESLSRTSREGEAIITVQDNGPGIPDSIKEKIFQPFFTTKPTGQGTGLGLSLSYDIVKAHGGELKVETKEGGGSTFIVLLPMA
jgi:signal transduction histidine kinase